MDQFNTIFIHFPQYHVVVCKECGFGVVPTHFKTHLSIKHAYLTAKTRNCIIQATAALIQGLAKSEKDVVYSSSTSELVPHLIVWCDGLKCIVDKQDGSSCGYICCGLHHMQAHCREQHGWTNTKKRGRSSKKQQSGTRKLSWVENVHYQQFFKTGGFQCLFEVEA